MEVMARCTSSPLGLPVVYQGTGDMSGNTLLTIGVDLGSHPEWAKSQNLVCKPWWSMPAVFLMSGIPGVSWDITQVLNKTGVLAGIRVTLQLRLVFLLLWQPPKPGVDSTDSASAEDNSQRADSGVCPGA